MEDLKNEDFLAFIESMKANDAKTAEVLLEGYDTLMEGKFLRKIMPYAAAAGILGAGIGTGALDDSTLYDVEKDAYEQMRYSSDDISKMIVDHEAAIKSGDAEARAIAYDALKSANVAIGYDREADFKFYWDKNLGRAFYPTGEEVPLDERQMLPALD